ncbi:MAG TPA: GNAT family N-acetyltransferase [Candidatus Methylomirabilis sp.]|nr:GNAT family N-acetyltransferase [Candidatus Methylomirabilis sp.]
MRLLTLDLELARRIEHAEAQAAVECAEALKRFRPASGAAVRRIAGGFAVYCGKNSPITQAVGMGLDGAVSAQEFDALEEFYRSREEDVRVETCPLADPTFIELFGRRGYRVTEFSNVLARPIGADEEWLDSGGDVTVERAGKDKIDLWTQTVSQGFADQFPVSHELLETMKMFAFAPKTELYLASVDGKVAGGGTLALHDGVAGLFGASTLPVARRRGVQTALLLRRLARAAQAGSDLAVSLAQPGSTSQRNIARQGFRVMYTRVKFEKGLK